MACPIPVLLHDDLKLIHRQLRQLLLVPIGPANDDLIDLVCSTEPKRDRQLALAEIASRRADQATLNGLTLMQLDQSADGVGVGRLAFQLQSQPVMARLLIVA